MVAELAVLKTLRFAFAPTVVVIVWISCFYRQSVFSILLQMALRTMSETVAIEVNSNVWSFVTVVSVVAIVVAGDSSVTV